MMYREKESPMDRIDALEEHVDNLTKANKSREAENAELIATVDSILTDVLGAIIDELLLYAATTIGKPMPVTFLIACVVAMWLICNEIISILENIQDMGVNIPAFLQPLVKHIRSQVEEQINIDKKEDKNSEDE